jgi:O-antigen/teichoic acid export membrane protein
MFGRSVFLGVLGQGAALLIGFVTSVLVARWLGPSNWGLLGVLLSAVYVCYAFIALGLPQAVSYFSSRSNAQAALAGNSLAYGGVVAAIIIPLAWLLAANLSEVVSTRGDTFLWVLAAAVVPVMFLRFAGTNDLVGTFRFGLYNALLVGSRVVFLVVAVLAVGVAGLGVAGGLLATGLGELTLAVAALSVVTRRRPAVDIGVFRAMVRYGARSHLGTIFQTLCMRIDILILSLFRPLSEVGYYVVAQFVAEVGVNLSRVFQGVVHPLVAREQGADPGGAGSIDSCMRQHALVTSLATAANAVVGGTIIVLAYGPGFHSALVPFAILLPGMLFLGSALVVSAALGGYGRPGLASQLAGVTAAATIALDLVLIPSFGIVGAALGSLGGYALYGIASLFALSRVSRLPLRLLVVPQRDDLAVYLRVGAAFRAKAAAARRSRPFSSGVRRV